jgi:hypothetical protein
MWRVLLIFCSSFVLLVSPVFAKLEFVQDVLFNPGSSYNWQTSGSEKFVVLSGNGHTYTVYDRGSRWDVISSDPFRALICDKYAPDACVEFTGNEIAKTQVNFPNGYVVKLGRVIDVSDPPPTVSIEPASGEFSDYVDVVISGSSGSVLYYSLDGSEPSIPYSGPIRLTDSATVKAKAVSASGSSQVVSRTYTKKVVPLSLTFSPDTSTIEKPITVSILPSEPDATVYYSLDGSEPSIPYSGPLTISSPVTLKAKAVKGSRQSPVYQKVYSYAPIQRTDEKFFHIPVDRSAVIKGAKDFISVASPGIWLFAVAFLGLLILAVARKVFNK